MARKKKEPQIDEVATEETSEINAENLVDEVVDDEVIDAAESSDNETTADEKALLTCTVEEKQFVEKGVVIRYGESVAVNEPFSSSLKSRIKAGFIKEVN